MIATVSAQSDQWARTESVQQKVKKEVAAANHCGTDADCASIFLGCPFGCQEYINQEEHSPLMEKLDAARQELRVLGVPECNASCLAKQAPPVCMEGECVPGGI